ncbi:MAG: maleylpyruvate isomerase family mycothiol-dependent enzyme [Acidimicrobiales bacterium]
MDLTRTETIDGMLDEYVGFADLIGGLDASEWAAPSRCDGWEVRDVAGHVVGLCEDVVAGVPGSRDSAQEAASLRGEAPAVVAERLRAAVEQLRLLGPGLDDADAWASPSGVPDLTMGEGILTLWYDTFVHADDIRAALDRPAADGPGLRAAVAYLEGELDRRGWGPARVLFVDQGEGFGAVAASGGGAGSPVHRVEARPFVMAATGRIDPTTIGLDAEVNIYAVA